jgi:hypothetical protein
MILCFKTLHKCVTISPPTHVPQTVTDRDDDACIHGEVEPEKQIDSSSEKRKQMSKVSVPILK